MAGRLQAGNTRKKREAASHAVDEDGREGWHRLLKTLLAEHRYMAVLLDMLREQLEKLESGSATDPHVVYELMHYMCHYPDAFHHPREDMIYQRAGELKADIADSIDTLQREHDFLSDHGENTLQAIKAWQDGSGSVDPVLKLAREYIVGLYRHMEVEEKLVFPQIEKLLSSNDWRDLEQEDLMAPVADPVFGPRVSREYRNVARKARRSLRRGVEDATLLEWIGIETILESLEVLSMAVDSSSAATKEHFNDVMQETRDLIDETREGGSGVLLLPLRCMVNNTGHYFSLLRDLAGISRDTAGDLLSLGRNLQSNFKLMRGDTESASAGRAADGTERTLH